MARSDLLLRLVRAGRRGDQEVFRRTVEALIAEERAKKHNVLADRLAGAIAENGRAGGPLQVGAAAADTFFVREPHLRLASLVLPELVARACTELIEEQL